MPSKYFVQTCTGPRLQAEKSIIIPLSRIHLPTHAPPAQPLLLPSAEHTDIHYFLDVSAKENIRLADWANADHRHRHHPAASSSSSSIIIITTSSISISSNNSRRRTHPSQPTFGQGHHRQSLSLLGRPNPPHPPPPLPSSTASVGPGLVALLWLLVVSWFPGSPSSRSVCLPATELYLRMTLPSGDTYMLLHATLLLFNIKQKHCQLIIA